MITSFAHKGLEKFFLTGNKAGIQPNHAAKLARQLAMLNVTKSPQEVGLPGWRLHQLTGSLSGHWAISVSGNWRLTFCFIGEHAEIVDYRDYH
jgi:toxin HigB-1